MTAPTLNGALLYGVVNPSLLARVDKRATGRFARYLRHQHHPPMPAPMMSRTATIQPAADEPSGGGKGGLAGGGRAGGGMPGGSAGDDGSQRSTLEPRAPQSVQSEFGGHDAYSAPLPPSSQSLSPAKLHESVQKKQWAKSAHRTVHISGASSHACGL